MPTPRFDPRRRRVVTLALMLVTALASFESTVVSTAMPTIIGDLGGLPLYSWVFSIYLLAATVMMPIYGRLADIYGRRRILLIAISVFLVGAVTCSVARSMPQLIAARGLQGLGAAGLVPIALTVSGDLFSLEQRARVQGLFSSVWGTASLIGPLLGAWMTMSFGWRSIFSDQHPARHRRVHPGRDADDRVAGSARRSARPGRGGEPRGRRDGAALRGAAPAGRRPGEPGPAPRAAGSGGGLPRPVRPAPAPAAPSPDSSRASSRGWRRRRRISAASCSEPRSSAWTRSSPCSSRARGEERPEPPARWSRPSSSSGRRRRRSPPA